MRGDVMKAPGWLIVGFAFGVASSAAVAFVVWVRWSEDRRAESASDAPSPPAATEEFALIAGDPMAALDQSQRISLMRWLAANPLYELIVRDYCQCADRHYHHPYLVATDLNGDGNSDIAALIGLKGKEGPAAFVVFNGPSTVQRQRLRSGQPAGHAMTRCSVIHGCLSDRPTPTTAMSSSRRDKRTLWNIRAVAVSVG
jgi:hypothetical protein